MGEGAPLQFDERALCKPLNADVAISLPPLPKEQRAEGGVAAVEDAIGPVVVKFHQRPLYEVVEYEVAHGEVEAVPVDYWAAEMG